MCSSTLCFELPLAHGDWEQSLFAMVARDVRDESRWGLVDLKELEDELDTARASRDHFEDVELKELNIMRLPSCVMALAVFETHETVLVFVRQTARNLHATSDHFFCAVQILDAVAICTNPRCPKASCGKHCGGLGGCQVERQCDARTLEGDPESPPFCVS